MSNESNRTPRPSNLRPGLRVRAGVRAGFVYNQSEQLASSLYEGRVQSAREA